MKPLRKLSNHNIGKGFLTLANGSCGIVDYEIKMRPSRSTGIGWITGSDGLMKIATKIGHGKIWLSSELTLRIVAGLKIKNRTSITITSVSTRTNLFYARRVIASMYFGRSNEKVYFKFSDERGDELTVVTPKTEFQGCLPELQEVMIPESPADPELLPSTILVDGSSPDDETRHRVLLEIGGRRVALSREDALKLGNDLIAHAKAG